MVADPIKIVITTEKPHTNEAERLTTLLDAGWSYIHLRYPELSLREVREIIENIPQRYHHSLKLHGHFELVHEFNLGGLHLNSRCPSAPAKYSGELSRTCHSVEEVAQAAQSRVYSYVTLSPIFPSVSKPGYGPKLSTTEMIEAAGMMPVIALGGITPSTLPTLNTIPFAGYAVLGTIAKASDRQTLINISSSYM